MDQKIFSDNEYRMRLSNLTRAMEGRNIAVLIITQPENIQYLTGFSTVAYQHFQPVLVTLKGRIVHICREIEATNAKAGWDSVRVEAVEWQDSLLERTIEILQDLVCTGQRLGIESGGNFLPAAISDDLKARLNDVEIVPGSGIVENLRRIKSLQELALMREAGAILCRAVELAGDRAEPTHTNDQIQLDLVTEIMSRGAACDAYMPYVGTPGYLALGLQTSASAQRTTHRWLQVAAGLNHYYVSTGRTLLLDSQVDKVASLRELARDAFQAMIEAMCPGAAMAEVDAAGRRLVQAAGYGDMWKHRGGYGLGICFPPGLGEYETEIVPYTDGILQEGMVFHLVPIIMHPELGPVGHTDSVLVTANGFEVLTAPSTKVA